MSNATKVVNGQVELQDADAKKTQLLVKTTETDAITAKRATVSGKIKDALKKGKTLDQKQATAKRKQAQVTETKAKKDGLALRERIYKASVHRNKTESIYLDLFKKYDGKTPALIAVLFAGNVWPSNTLKSGKVKALGLSNAKKEFSGHRTFGKIVREISVIDNAFGRWNGIANKKEAEKEAATLAQKAEKGDKKAKEAIALESLKKLTNQLNSALGSIASALGNTGMKPADQIGFYNKETEKIDKAIELLNKMSGPADPTIIKRTKKELETETA